MEVYNLNELQRALELSKDLTESSIWLLLTDVEYPYMNIIIKDDMAYVHYFERTGQPGYQSVGRSADDGVISINQEDQITVPVAALVSVCEAGYAGAEFYKTRTMPTAIEWYEL